MEDTKNTPTNKDKAARWNNRSRTTRRRSNYQVLARIGKPPRVDRLEVCKQHNGKYRVNIWKQTDPKKDIAVTPSPQLVCPTI